MARTVTSCTSTCGTTRSAKRSTTSAGRRRRVARADTRVMLRVLPMRSHLAILIFVLACSTGAQSTEAAPSAGAPAKAEPKPAPKPDASKPAPPAAAKVDAKAAATAVLDKQLAAIKANDDKAIAGTFAADAVVLAPHDPAARKVSDPAGVASALAMVSGSASVK